MPERVTKKERIVSLAIEKARKAKEELSAKKRKNIEPTQVLEIDTDPEVEKIKRPKVQDASKITNQTRKDEGYGLAGESLKKADRKILGYDVIYFKDGKRKVKSFRNQKIIPVRTGRGVKNMPDIQPAKLFASKNDANTIKTIYE